MRLVCYCHSKEAEKHLCRGPPVALPACERLRGGIERGHFTVDSSQARLLSEGSRSARTCVNTINRVMNSQP